METTPTGQRSQARLFVSGQPPSAMPEEGTKGSNGGWWETPYGGWRLATEVEAMRERFPAFRLVVGDEGRLCWVGRLRSAMSRKRYALKVTYPRGFPDESPVVVIEKHGFPSGTPHLMDGKRPCLYLPSQGPRNGYDPARTTAATMVAWTALWIHAYEAWRATAVWPGRGD